MDTALTAIVKDYNSRIREIESEVYEADSEKLDRIMEYLQSANTAYVAVCSCIGIKNPNPLPAANVRVIHDRPVEHINLTFTLEQLNENFKAIKTDTQENSQAEKAPQKDN